MLKYIVIGDKVTINTNLQCQNIILQCNGGNTTQEQQNCSDGEDL